jgi:Kef-type K+ transport system membrane component KefB
MLLHLLAALAAVVLLGRLLGRLFRVIHQPPVIGEVVAGIVLGPSLLGHLWPDAYAFILPSSVAPSLGLLSQLGVVLYMFLVGIELDTDVFRGQIRSTAAISLTSILVPFALGVWLAAWLYPELAPNGVKYLHFALFVGVAMSITAFPVLARILTDRGMSTTPLGRLSLTCAAVDDVTAWCLLAFVVGIVQSGDGREWLPAVLTVVFIVFMFIAVRPLVVTLANRSTDRQGEQTAIAMALVGALLSALATEAIGVHAIFGAFLLGAVIPHNSRLATVLRERVEYPVTILLLPAFFAFAGMRTEIGLLDSAHAWLICGAIIVIATGGKFGAGMLAARVVGHDWRHAAGLGILMNTRGLMELIVLNVGLDLGIISPALFTMMVLMALVTTMATTPSLAALQRSEMVRPREGLETP